MCQRYRLNLGKRSKMIIFESLLTAFEVKSTFGDSCGRIKHKRRSQFFKKKNQCSYIFRVKTKQMIIKNCCLSASLYNDCSKKLDHFTNRKKVIYYTRISKKISLLTVIYASRTVQQHVKCSHGLYLKANWWKEKQL